MEGHLKLRPSAFAPCRTLNAKNCLTQLMAEWFSEHRHLDLSLTFEVQHAGGIGVRDPLSENEPWEQSYHDFEIHLGRDYIHHSSPSIIPTETEILCECGLRIDFQENRQDVFFAARIYFRCPKCLKTFDPNRITAHVREGWSNQVQRTIIGGATYRFAVVVDCGKCLPDLSGDLIRANPDFLNLCRRVFKTDFYQIGEIY